MAKIIEDFVHLSHIVPPFNRAIRDSYEKIFSKIAEWAYIAPFAVLLFHVRIGACLKLGKSKRSSSQGHEQTLP